MDRPMAVRGPVVERKTAVELRITTLAGMIAFAALTRLLPHPPNFTAVTALALFAGAQFADRRMAFFVPLAALFATDLVLGLHSGMLFVYGCVAAMVLMGRFVGPRSAPLRVAGAAFAGSVLFFIVTNFGVWAMSGLYEKSLAGLTTCYIAAIPFFQNTLAGDLFFAALLFGGFEVMRRKVPALAAAR
jgi:hypothetical protein